MTVDPLSMYGATSARGLRQLAAVCRESVSTGMIPPHALRQVLGLAAQARASDFIDELSGTGWSLDQIATLFEHVALTREAAEAHESLFELVLSGPQVDGVATRDTFAVMNELFVAANTEVLLVGYAVYGGSELFRNLAERLTVTPGLRVWFCLDIPRRPNDASEPAQIVQRYTKDFYARQWPWMPRPAIYYDARSLLASPNEKASLHAKCIIVDRQVALITSANFTQAAQHRNVEAGILVHHRPHVEKLVAYFNGLRDTGVLALAQ